MTFPYPRSVIPERLQPLVAETAEVAARFADAGHRLFLVGGVVRDLIVNRLDPGADLDFATDPRPDDIEAIVTGWADAVWTQGKRFGTIGSKRGDLTYEIDGIPFHLSTQIRQTGAKAAK